jgi:hypothetical protein
MKFIFLFATIRVKISDFPVKEHLYFSLSNSVIDDNLTISQKYRNKKSCEDFTALLVFCICYGCFGATTFIASASNFNNSVITSFVMSFTGFV